MPSKSIITFIVVCSMSLSLFSQEQDSIKIQQKVDNKYPLVSGSKVDTISWANIDKEGEHLLKTTKLFKPDPKKAVIYSAIFPGLGQIYNRKYWKLPIIYGGFIGLAYAISWNGRYYSDYSDGYKAIMSENRLSPENITKWQDFLPSKVNPEELTASDIKTWQDFFKRKKNFYRRNRDLSIIGAVALYALSMIDAYVDAQLFDFDISPDLSLRVEPKVENDAFARKTFGLQCSFKF